MSEAFLKSCLSVSTAFLLAALCSGCVGRRSYAKHQFVLAAQRPALPAGASRDAVLAVRGFTIDPVADSRGLLYRKGESEYESDFYHEFLIAPQVLISSQARHWLAQSGLFTTVLEPGSLLEPTHVLEGNVLALHGDFRGSGRPQAVMRIRIFVVANRGPGPELAFTRDYQASYRAQEQTAAALVAALDQCLAQILGELETDLAGAL